MPDWTGRAFENRDLVHMHCPQRTARTALNVVKRETQLAFLIVCAPRMKQGPASWLKLAGMQCQLISNVGKGGGLPPSPTANRRPVNFGSQFLSANSAASAQREHSAAPVVVMSVEVSHGRGGAGNINADDTQYVDGEVVRSGPEGSHGDGAYSAGRGGAGNIADVGTTSSQRKDQDIIPDVAVRASQDTQDYHTGRGGAGNEHTSAERAKSPPAKTNGGATGEAPISLADKLKEKLFGAFKK
ncbi:hypothetical protein Purlil1_9042 [Purpureocillium lilacinum]|uniref:Uncharacterized protein n=1 Tax=Purpureocillium lilacinum TaxID=33203 RepID=A0ABR0BS15_PURLI|nr:hypothetical protein Purlil1_9042 [Purpureocillium lilacinum]